MTSRQPRWTGPKTHAVCARLPQRTTNSVWKTYRHKSHAEQALEYYARTYKDFVFTIEPLKQDRRFEEGWKRLSNIAGDKA